MQVELRAEALDLGRHGIARERAGRNDDLTVRDGVGLGALDGDVRMRADALRDLARERLAVHGERAAGGDAVVIRARKHDGVKPAQLLLEQADGVRELIAAQGVGADELGKVFGYVRGGHFLGFHLDQAHRDAAPGQLPRALASRQARTDHGHWGHSVPPRKRRP